MRRIEAVSRIVSRTEASVSLSQVFPEVLTEPPVDSPIKPDALRLTRQFVMRNGEFVRSNPRTVNRRTHPRHATIPVIDYKLRDPQRTAADFDPGRHDDFPENGHSESEFGLTDQMKDELDKVNESFWPVKLARFMPVDDLVKKYSRI